MRLYITVITKDQNATIDCIHAKLTDGREVVLTWDESEYYHLINGFFAILKGVYIDEEYANGKIDSLKGMQVTDVIFDEDDSYEELPEKFRAIITIMDGDKDYKLIAGEESSYALSNEKELEKRKDPEPEKLTAGLLKSLIKGRNIPALERFLDGREDDQEMDLLDRNDYIALKLWTEADIRDVLESEKYPVTDENVSAVIGSGDLEGLNDCTDDDWEIIYQAIKESACRYNSFELLYRLKCKWLMLECMHDTDKANSFADTFMKRYKLPSTECAMEKFLAKFNDYLRGLIGLTSEESLEYELDYPRYTQKVHGRKFFNEIQNPEFLEKLIKKAIELIPGIRADGKQCLSLYDFNDYDIFFESEEVLSWFVKRYAVAPATAFEKTDDGSYRELWSI